MALRKVTTLLVVHVTATPASRGIGVAEVRAMQQAQGRSDIGYNALIRRDCVARGAVNDKPKVPANPIVLMVQSRLKY